MKIITGEDLERNYPIGTVYLECDGDGNPCFDRMPNIIFSKFVDKNGDECIGRVEQLVDSLDIGGEETWNYTPKENLGRELRQQFTAGSSYAGCFHGDFFLVITPEEIKRIANRLLNIEKFVPKEWDAYRNKELQDEPIQ